MQRDNNFFRDKSKNISFSLVKIIGIVVIPRIRDRKECRMLHVSKKILLRAVGILVLFAGCSSTLSVSRHDDPMAMEIDSFQSVSKPCLDHIKDSVANAFGPAFFYKNTVKSREPHFLEAIFARNEGQGGDSVVVVKVDVSCGIKRMYRTRMTIMETN
jgi:hypothetical protein